MRRIAGLKVVHVVVLCALLPGCAGFARSCTSFNARNYGSDWMIVQYDYTMAPKMCWKLHNVSVANEEHSDGIHWLDDSTNAMKHIGGWYNYEQVVNHDFYKSALALGVDVNRCGHGAYPATKDVN